MPAFFVSCGQITNLNHKDKKYDFSSLKTFKIMSLFRKVI
ncbi:MAG: Uncharacterised protein [SAR116 cluster bacterium]|nr:MAG: Uncharacterised protein [SAR116 cluster bacterium]